MSLKIQLLAENLASDMVWMAEWGFSAWIEFNGSRILFDTGYSDVYCRNAEYAGIDLQTVDFVALSHLHRDHTRGLLSHPFQSRVKLVTHPRVLTDSLATDDASILRDYADIQATIERDFDVMATRECIEICSGAYFLGEIPRVTAFEKGTFFDDPMPDDTAMAFATSKGVVVLAGCSHAGICNICEYAKKISGQNLYAVIGGFHLLHDEDPPVEQTIAYFKTERPAYLAPVHCIDFDIQTRLQSALQYQRPGSGSIIEL